MSPIVGKCTFCHREGWHKQESDGRLTCFDEDECLRIMREKSDQRLADSIRRHSPVTELFDE